MLISITECKAGAVWTGRPDLGLWCNTQQPALTSRGCSEVSSVVNRSCVQAGEERQWLLCTGRTRTGGSVNSRQWRLDTGTEWVMMLLQYYWH